MSIKVCSFARVSTGVQDYERQLSDITTFCQAHRYEIVREFAEKESGRNRERKELSNLLTYCEDNKDSINYVVVSELSRLGRTGEVINTVERLNDLKVGLISLKENLHTLNDDRSVNHTASLVMGILSSINSYELTTTKYRSISGLLHSAQNGNWGGGKLLPYGYMRGGENGKKLVINPKEAELVQKMFQLYLDGYGCPKIASIFSGWDVPTRTGVKWRDKVVYDILRNTIYIGKRKYKGEILSSPVIIDEDTFRRVNTLLKENFNKDGINKKYDFLLDGRIITCGVCGKSYYAHKRASLKDNTYKCVSIRYYDNCGNYGISIPKLEYAIRYVVATEFKDLIQVDKEKVLKMDTEYSGMMGQLDKLNKEENRLIHLYTQGLITLEKFTLEQGKVKKQIETIEKDRTELRMKIKEHFITADREYQAKQDPKNIYKDNIRQVVKSIVITKDEKVLSTVAKDRTVRVDVRGYNDSVVTLYLSQRAKYFLCKNKRVVYE